MEVASTPHHKFSLQSAHSFIKIAIISEDGASILSDVKRLKFAINNELRLVFGEVGAAKAECDVLSLTKSIGDDAPTAILRIQHSQLQFLWGALSMCTTIDTKLCKLQVLHVSSSLLGLASPRFL